MSQNISVSNKHCSFEYYFPQRMMEKNVTEHKMNSICQDVTLLGKKNEINNLQLNRLH